MHTRTVRAKGCCKIKSAQLLLHFWPSVAFYVDRHKMMLLEIIFKYTVPPKMKIICSEKVNNYETISYYNRKSDQFICLYMMLWMNIYLKTISNCNTEDWFCWRIQFSVFSLFWIVYEICTIVLCLVYIWRI